ncbi:MAG: YtxH domain-containing protein [Balneolaceae bacterium]
MKNTRMILTALSATATGVLIGLLYAPNKGTATREKITKKSQEYSDYIVDRVDDFVDSVSRPLEDMGDEAERLADKAKSKAKKATADANSRMS